MKYLLALIAAMFAGCVTDENGNTRFDAEGTAKVINTGFDAYDRYQQSQRPVYQQVLYDQYGNPIYPVR